MQTRTWSFTIPLPGHDVRLLRLCRRMGKPYGLFGQSYAPRVVSGREEKDLLAGAAFVYCRETRTLDMLRQAGLRPPVLDFNPDGCFGIDVKNDPAATAFLSAHGLEEHRFMTIQLRTHTPIMHLYSPFLDSDGWDHHGKCHMFVDVGMSDWMAPLDEWSASELFERLRRIDADPAGARASVRQAMSFVHEKFSGAAQTIRRAVGVSQGGCR